MKTLGELAKELRTNTGDFGATMDEAADRLEMIERTWLVFMATEGIDWERYSFLPPSSAFEALQTAIEGKEP